MMGSVHGEGRWGFGQGQGADPRDLRLTNRTIGYGHMGSSTHRNH